MSDQNNKLIAEFIGLESNEQGYLNDHNSMDYLSGFPSRDYGRLPLEQLRFDVDWNWLMVVVEKIESIIFENDEYYNFNILGGCYVIVISSHGNELITSDNGQSKLECVYNAVVEFIKWYNDGKV